MIMTSALSSFNSNFFAASRMILNLAEQGQAPNSMKKISKNGVPYIAVIGIACTLFAGVLLSLSVPKTVFDVMVGSGSTSVLITYTIILTTHHKYRKSLTKEELDKAKFKLPFYPFSTAISAVFVVISLGVIAYRPTTRLGLVFAFGYYAVLTVLFFARGMNKKMQAKNNW